MQSLLICSIKNLSQHRLWYFREDIGINLHHWHWHLVYPFEASNRALVDKDRRGELFYYMHEQVVLTFNTEFPFQIENCFHFDVHRLLHVTISSDLVTICHALSD